MNKNIFIIIYNDRQFDKYIEDSKIISREDFLAKDFLVIFLLLASEDWTDPDNLQVCMIGH